MIKRSPAQSSRREHRRHRSTAMPSQCGMPYEDPREGQWTSGSTRYSGARRLAGALLLLVAGVLGLGRELRAEAEEGRIAPTEVEARHAAGIRYFGEVPLLDQTGREWRLYSDLLKDRAVVIHPFFSSCPGVCPALMGKLREVRAALGERLGRDVFFLSISVDPETDTPDKLRAYAEEHEVTPGWLLLSGRPENVTQALRKLGQYVEEPEAHTNLLIVGNERTGLWKKAFGLSKTEDLVTIVRSVIDDPGATATDDAAAADRTPVANRSARADSAHTEVGAGD